MLTLSVLAFVGLIGSITAQDCGSVVLNSCDEVSLKATYKYPTLKNGGTAAIAQRFTMSSPGADVKWTGYAGKMECNVKEDNFGICGTHKQSSGNEVTQCPQGGIVNLNGKSGDTVDFFVNVRPEQGVTECKNITATLEIDGVFNAAGVCVSPLSRATCANVPQPNSDPTPAATATPATTETTNTPAPTVAGSCGVVTLNSCKPHYFEAVYRLPQSDDTHSAVQTKFKVKSFDENAHWTGAITNSRCASTGFHKCEASQYEKGVTECPLNGVSENGDSLGKIEFYAVIKPAANTTNCAGTVVSLQLDSIFDGPGTCLKPLKEIKGCHSLSSSDARAVLFGLGAFVLGMIALGVCCCCMCFCGIMFVIVQSNKKSNPQFQRV